MSYVKTPSTNFSMRANLEQLTARICNYWEEANIMQKFFHWNEAKPMKLLICGPPYANGILHTGHRINFILKDIYNLWWRSQGYNVSHFVGFDCHGRPIEYKVNASINSGSDTQTILKHIEQCRALAESNVESQYDQLKQMGIFTQSIGSRKYYTTYDEYSSIYEAFSNLLLNGRIYTERRPMLWSLEDASVISEIETEYRTKISTAVYVALRVQNTNDHVVIWTTTPWTLIDNAAVCYNKNLNYVKVEMESQSYIVCASLADDFIKKLNSKPHCVIPYIVEDIRVHHPIHNYYVKVIHGNHVTSDMGTGFVHTAPAHGQEDFEIARAHNIEWTESVSSTGHYICAPLQGLHIFDDEIEILKHINVIHQESYEHSYIFALRSNKPVIYRSSLQVFANLSSLNLEPVKNIYTMPKHLAGGLHDYVQQRNEWCLSRNRVWGVPMALMINESGEIYINKNFQNAIVQQMEMNHELFLHQQEFINFARSHNVPTEYEPMIGVLDVWFDSACVYELATKLLGVNIPATFIEGTDQKRGWFQSSLLQRLLQNKSLPFNEIISHGFVVDGTGRKLSKSLGNMQEVENVISSYGIEILRIRMMECDYTTEISISKDIMSKCAEKYRKIRNVLRYLISICETYEIYESTQELPELENIYLYKLHITYQKYIDLMNKYRFNEAFSILYNFIIDTSSTYFNGCKKILYEQEDIHKQHILYAMNIMLIYLLQMLRCVLPFTTEEAFLYTKSFKLSNIWQLMISRKSMHLVEPSDLPFYEFKQCMLHLYDETIQKISQKLAEQNITTGYEQDYILHIGHTGLNSSTLQRVFNFHSVIMIENGDIHITKA